MKEPMKCEQIVKTNEWDDIFLTYMEKPCGGELEYRSVFVASIDFKNKNCVYRGIYQCKSCKDVTIK